MKAIFFKFPLEKVLTFCHNSRESLFSSFFAFLGKNFLTGCLAVKKRGLRPVREGMAFVHWV
jgi:putative flippase GtrA